MDLQVFRELPLFAGLDAAQLAHVASITEERLFPKNSIIFEQDATPAELFVIQKGRVRISKVIPGMGEEALAVLPEGAYFGEMELIGPNLPRAAQATAHEDCILLVISYADFHALLNTERELAVAVLWSFVRTLSTRLRDTDDKVAATFAMAQFN